MQILPGDSSERLSENRLTVICSSLLLSPDKTKTNFVMFSEKWRLQAQSQSQNGPLSCRSSCKPPESWCWVSFLWSFLGSLLGSGLQLRSSVQTPFRCVTNHPMLLWNLSLYGKVSLPSSHLHSAGHSSRFVHSTCPSVAPKDWDVEVSRMNVVFEEASCSFSLFSAAVSFHENKSIPWSCMKLEQLSEPLCSHFWRSVRQQEQQKPALTSKGVPLRWDSFIKGAGVMKTDVSRKSSAFPASAL